MEPSDSQESKDKKILGHFSESSSTSDAGFDEDKTLGEANRQDKHNRGLLEIKEFVFWR